MFKPRIETPSPNHGQPLFLRIVAAYLIVSFTVIVGELVFQMAYFAWLYSLDSPSPHGFGMGFWYLVMLVYAPYLIALGYLSLRERKHLLNNVPRLWRVVAALVVNVLPLTGMIIFIYGDVNTYGKIIGGAEFFVMVSIGIALPFSMIVLTVLGTRQNNLSQPRLT